MAGQSYNASINLSVNANAAKGQLEQLQKQLQQIANMKINIGGTSNLTTQLEEASAAAMKLQAHLATAMNPQTGNLDFTKFYSSIQKSGASLEDYGKALQNIGPAGQKTFVNLADSIAKSEIPLKRTSKMVDNMWAGLKRTASWQLQSSIIHGFVGSIQQAVGYAQDLNKSLTDIRIVTGASSDQMAKFAKQANIAAKNLSTTTTDYTRASLIYYQQGLSDAEVQKRAETTIKMANATGTSAAKVSDQMTAIWNNYDNGTKSLEHYGDVMTALGAKTASSTDEIAAGLQKFASISQTVGLSYEYAASALATVTATSRESADVVGNAFKTLFARIQGLNLGETLDDGTTLNKYSTALAKVGISIKDTFGNMKDMDTILDEMGGKWNTLSQDQQTALAQTVGGVRQYTQLMTLMNNWDFFKENLQTANTSGGTLDKQAAIYAESWEAASNRVRASWEGLWDNIVDSDSFITTLDMISSLVGMLDNMVSGLGGAGGTLLTFGGILTKVFNKQIAGTISDIGYNINMLRPSVQKKIKAEQESFIVNAQDIMSQNVITDPLYGPTESRVRKTSLLRSLEMSKEYLNNKDHMSADQIFMEQLYSEQTAQAEKIQIDKARRLDKAQKDVGKALFEFNTMVKDENEQTVEKNLLATGIKANKNSIQASIGALQRDIEENDRTIQDKKTSEEEKAKAQQANENVKKSKKNLESILESPDSLFSADTRNRDKIGEAYGNAIDKRIKELETEKGKLDPNNVKNQKKIENLNNQITQLENEKERSITKRPLEDDATYRDAIIAQTKAQAELKSVFDQVSNAGSNTEKAQLLLKGLIDFSNSAPNNSSASKLIQDLESFAMSITDDNFDAEKFQEYVGGFDSLISKNNEKMADVIFEQLQAGGEFKGTKEQVASAIQAYQEWASAKKDNQNQPDLDFIDEQRKENMKKEKMQSAAEKLVTGAESAMEALAAGEAIKSLFLSLQDGSATITSSLTGIISAISESASSFEGFHSILSSIPNLGSGAAFGISLATTALLTLASTAIEVYDQMNTSNQEMKQNFINSDNELTSAASTAAEAAEIAKTQNEEYLEGINKIKSLSQDPTTLAEDIYESNKRALELINQYDLQQGANGYTYGANGLIEIDKQVLDSQVEQKEDEAQIADYAQLMGKVINNVGQAQIDAVDVKKTFSDMVQNSIINGHSWMPTEEEFLQARRGGDEAWAALQEKYNWDNLNPFQTAGFKTFSGITYGLTEADWTKWYNEAGKVIDAESGIDAAGIQVDQASQVVANKILADNNITAATQEGFAGYQTVIANSVKQQFQDAKNIVDTTSNQILDEDAVKQILASQGQQGAHGFRMDSGIVYYTLDGESQERSYTGATLNSINAANQVDNQKAISAANEAWINATEKFGTKAAEAGFNIEQLGTISGASADSVQALFQDETVFRDAYGENQALAQEEYNKVSKIFGGDGIVQALGLDPTTLSRLSMDTLETLQNSITGMGADGFTQVGELFKGIKEVTGAETPEDLAKIVTALSSLDFSKNSYLNLTDLQATLESFGFSVDTSGLEALYTILTKLAGLGPGGSLENLADTNKKITDKRGSLNEITPGGEVDEATMQNAKNAGLTNNWVKSGDDKYTYTGSQKDIDYAKRMADRAFAENQMKIDTQQSAYTAARAKGMNLTGNYEDSVDLARALGLNMSYDSWEHQYQFSGEGNNNISALETALGLEPGQLKSMMNSNPSNAVDMINEFLSNGAMEEDTQSSGVEDYMAQVTSARDMMSAVNDAESRGDTAGFLDEHGIISDSALERMDTYAKTSERVSSALQNLKDAKQQLYEMEKEYEADNEVTGEEQSNFDRQQEIYDEALAQYDLATAIDAVAAARGLDAEQMAYRAEQLQSEGKLQDKDLSGEDIADYVADLIEQQEAVNELAKSFQKLDKAINGVDQSAKFDSLSQMKSLMEKLTGDTTIATMSMSQFEKAYKHFTKDYPQGMSKILKGDVQGYKDLYKSVVKATIAQEKNVDTNKKTPKSYDDSMEGLEDYADSITEQSEELQADIAKFSPGETLSQQVANDPGLQDAYDNIMGQFNNIKSGIMASVPGISEASAAAMAAGTMGMKAVAHTVDLPATESTVTHTDLKNRANQDETDGSLVWEVGPTETTTTSTEGGTAIEWELIPMDAAPSGGGGGGGGGGGAKEPKKVANKRKSQTVKRYKRNDAKRKSAESAKKSEEQKKDYLYGESKIAQMQKINKLAEKEAHITSDRIKESQEYLVEDRKNLIKYLQKYGFDAEFETDGFLANYEEVWTKLHEELAALYEDNLLTEDEEKIEEDINVKIEELEGALEDYENSLQELQDDIEKYEESMYEMYDNKVEQIEHKVEYNLELNDDDLQYFDFLIEALGDNASKAADAIGLMGDKATVLFSGIQTISDGIQDLYSLSKDPLQIWATGGLDEAVLTDAQIEALRDNRDELADYTQQLLELREDALEKLLDSFDSWQEKLDSSLTTVEHYSSVLETFKNIIDVTGRDVLRLSNGFVTNLETKAINQSLDDLDANKAYYESLASAQKKAQEELNAARQRNDEASIEQWEEALRTINESVESAQEEMLSALENSLSLIADQFEAAIERAVDAFNDSIYAHGGLEGLSNDYSTIRENADLMADDYDKIYNLSKINRNINKTLDDTKIIAGKNRLISLQKEINDLQRSGVQLSQYDLEYLQAKYELYLAQIELENAQNAKSTVRLSKDTEGNWSYVYTQNADAVEEAEQKYEDALYHMQQMSYEYVEEMSSMMVDTSTAMMEELTALRIQDFNSYEDYQAEVQRIQDKYADVLNQQESELNKAVSNNKNLYDEDWRNYSLITGYKISEGDKWADHFSETTLGTLMDSSSSLSDFMQGIMGSSDNLVKDLGESAWNYFAGVEKALNVYGTSINRFGDNITTTTNRITTSSKKATDDMKDMALSFSKDFKNVAEELSNWQEEFSLEIDKMLEKIKTLIQSINDSIEASAKMGKKETKDLIGQEEAVDLLNEKEKFGHWTFNKKGDLDYTNGTKTEEGIDFVWFNGELIKQIDEKMERYFNSRTGSDERDRLGEELKQMFKDYWEFRDIVNRIYDIAELDKPTYAEPSSYDTGGYTGEWGPSGRLAMLHQKELVLNADDTSNFLDALTIAKDLLETIELNATQSRLGLGELVASTIQDYSQTLEQEVSITAEFPNVTDRTEIEEAFNNLVNTASQYANRK